VSEQSLVDLPQAEEALAADPDIAQIMAEVVHHYGVAQCVFTWRESGYLLFMVVPGGKRFRVATHPDTQLFNHTILRKLPVIMNDIEQVTAYRSEDLPRCLCQPRFYAAVPLVFEERLYLGTLCIVDAVSRPAFSLGDADYLVNRGAALLTAVQRCVDFARQCQRT
jgi:GAF domain-containing protein